MSIDLTKTTEPRSAVAAGPLRPGPVPRAVAPAAWLGMLGAVALTGVGLAALYDAAVAFGLWNTPALFVPGRGALAEVSPGPLVLTVSVLLVLVAAALFVSVTFRRPARAYRVRAGTGVYLMHEDAARLVEHDARLVAGVLRARVRAGRRRLVADLETTGGDAIITAVEEVVAQRLSALDPMPEVRVRAIVRAPQAKKSDVR